MFSHLMIKNTNVLPLLKSLNEGRVDDKELEISHLDMAVLCDTRGNLVVLLREAANFSSTTLISEQPFTIPSFIYSTSRC